IRRVAESVWRLPDPVRPVVQKARLDLPFRRSGRPGEFPPRADPAVQGDLFENLANPGGIIVDIEKVAAVAHEAGIPLIVDNTLATPYLCRPFDWGADLIVHSSTECLGGHGAALGGMVAESGKFDWSQGGRFP